jgi:hypothetical protein
VPAHIGVQRLLRGAEGVEQVKRHLPVVPFVVPLRRSGRALGGPGRVLDAQTATSR